MTHSRACPVCGKVIPWSFEEPILKRLPNGETFPVRHAKLICPEHGEFRNRAEEKVLNLLRTNGM